MSYSTLRIQKAKPPECEQYLTVSNQKSTVRHFQQARQALERERREPGAREERGSRERWKGIFMLCVLPRVSCTFDSPLSTWHAR